MSSQINTLNNRIKLKGGKTAGKKDTGKDKTKGKGDKSKNKGAKAKGKNDKKWAWKDVPPKNGEKTKQFGGKTYHWCKWHEAWTIHSPETCNKNPSNDNDGSSGANGANNQVSFSTSVTQIMEDLEEEEL